MNRRKLKILSLILPLAFAAAVLISTAVTANALDTVTYIDHDTDGTSVPAQCSEYAKLTNETTAWPESANGWYVVTGNDVVIEERFTISGEVNLILCDGAKLTAKKGITVDEGKTLNLYAQSNGSGALLAGTVYGFDMTCSQYCAAIGGSKDNNGGTVCVHGGNVTAKGGFCGAGIGGGSSKDSGASGDGGTFTVYGGNVSATGGRGGAGIGGGYGGKGSTVAIYEGDVTAAGDSAAGIGGGYADKGSTVTIYGGKVTATGGTASAGIGGASDNGGTVTVYGGDVTAIGNDGGAGIGGGKNASGGIVTIYEGDVTAIGNGGGAGIGGGGKGGYGAVVSIYGGDVTAAGSDGGVGIGAGSEETKNNPLNLGRGVTLYGGISESEAAEIEKEGGDYERFEYMKTSYTTPEPQDPVNYRKAGWNGSEVAYTTEDVPAEYIEVESYAYETVWEDGTWYVVKGADVFIKGRITVNGTVNLVLCDGATLDAKQGITVGEGKTLNIYAQSEGSGVLIAGKNKVASGYDEDIYSAGIGGKSGNGGTVNIHGGNVTAVGNNKAAGIGGGFEGSGGTVTIYGGNVTAAGTGGGAGIGGGDAGNGGSVTINGGRVMSIGDAGGAGIGGGYGGNGITVNINGGNVTAIGSENNNHGGAGIGGGCRNNWGETGGNGGTVNISGGKVTAAGGNSFAAGIGHGSDNTNDGTLTAGDGLDVYGGTSTDQMTVITPDGGVYARSRYMVVSSTAPHIHDFSYAANGNTITAVCQAADCTLPDNKAILTVFAEDDSYSADPYTGARLDSKIWTAAGLSVPTIEYEGKGDTAYPKSADAPTEAGTYTASVTADSDKTATANFTISPWAMTITGATATGRAYSKDNKIVDISKVTFKDNLGPVGMEMGVDYTARGVMETDTAGNGKSVTVTVTLINMSCSLDSNTTTTTVDISKAAAPSIEPVAVSQLCEQTDFSKSIANLMPDDAGVLSYTAGTATKTGSVTVSGFTVDPSGNVNASLAGGAAGDKVTLPVIIRSTNYADTTAKIEITLKENADVSIAGVPEENKTYGDADFTLTGSVAAAGSETGRWTWTSSDEEVLRVTPDGAAATVKILKAGSATITADYESDTSIGTETTSSITVDKKSLTVKAIDKSIKVGETVPDLSYPLLDTDYTVTGLIGTDTLTGAPRLEYASEPDNTKAGTYTITASNASADDNYRISYQEGTLTVNKESADKLGLKVLPYNAPYDSEAHSVTATVDVEEGTTISYSTDGETWKTTAPAWTDVTTAQTVYVKAESDSFSTATADSTVTITSRAITVNDTANETYDGTPKTLTITADKASGVLAGETLTLTGATISGTDVGSYTEVAEYKWSVVKADGATDSTGNYTISVNGTLTISEDESAPTPTPEVTPTPESEPAPKPTPAPGSDPTQKGRDGTAVGPGASAAAAEKVITTMKSDTDPEGSVFMKLRLRSTKQTEKSITLKWTKNSKAVKYVIYGNKCGKTIKPKKLATVMGKNTRTFKKVAGKKVKKGTYYKFIVVALDKNNNVVSTSKLIHATTKGGEVGNCKSVTVKKSVINKAKKLNKGKTLKLNAKAVAQSKKLTVKNHAAIRYESGNKNIAAVTPKGVVKAKKKGTCFIYAYAQNGVYKKIKVTVN